jgi:acyl-coenzyme A synthetase/AMP-(fatty) acid ligase
VTVAPVQRAAVTGFDCVGNRSLVRAIAFNREWMPERSFLEYRGCKLSYGDFGRMVARAANGLMRLGVRAGDRVLIQMANCPEHLVAIYVRWVEKCQRRY